MEYREVPGFNGYYLATRDGRIFRRTAGEPAELKWRIGHGGYHVIAIRRPDGQATTMGVHRAVALAYLPNPEGLPMVRHLDDDKSNNWLYNLAWGTASDNGFDSVRNGTHGSVRRTHCSNGHERTPENLVERPKPDGRTTLTCKLCELERVRRGYAKNAEKRRQYAKDRVANMTPEERQELNAYHTRWNREKRERLRAEEVTTDAESHPTVRLDFMRHSK